MIQDEHEEKPAGCCKKKEEATSDFGVASTKAIQAQSTNIVHRGKHVVNLKHFTSKLMRYISLFYKSPGLNSIDEIQ